MGANNGCSITSALQMLHKHLMDHCNRNLQDEAEINQKTFNFQIFTSDPSEALSPGNLEMVGVTIREDKRKTVV